MNRSRLTSTVVLIAGLFLLSVLPVTSVFANSPPPCSVTVTGENVGNNAIQTAIDAAEALPPPQVVCVNPGTYPEQLVILSSGITLRGLPTSGHPVLIQPTSVSPNSVSTDSSTQQSNIILVNGEAIGITGDAITGLTVDGSLASSSFNSCSIDYEGILFRDAGGTISGNTVENIYLPVADAGCQPGDAILVQTSASYYYSVSITNNHAINYNKNGITCHDSGTTCQIEHNTAYPYAPYDQYIATNGIEVAFGAKATVSGNTVTGNICTLATVCGPNPLTQTTACGILTYQSASGTVVKNNNVNDNQIGICAANDKTTITSNKLSHESVSGVLLYDGTGSYSLSRNSYSHDPIGIQVISDGSAGYSGTFTSKISDSSFSSTPTKVQIITQTPGSATVKFLSHTYFVSGDSTVSLS